MWNSSLSLSLFYFIIFFFFSLSLSLNIPGVSANNYAVTANTTELVGLIISAAYCVKYKKEYIKLALSELIR